MSEERTIWVTKWALTQGIIKAEGCQIEKGYGTRNMGRADYLFVRMGTDAFESEAEAKANVLVKIRKRLKNLDKQRVKLKALQKSLEGV